MKLTNEIAKIIICFENKKIDSDKLEKLLNAENNDLIFLRSATMETNFNK